MSSALSITRICISTRYLRYLCSHVSHKSCWKSQEKKQKHMPMENRQEKSMHMPVPAKPPAHHFLWCLIQPHANPGSFTMDFCQLCASSLAAKNTTLTFILSVHWLPLTGGKILPPGCLSCSREQAKAPSASPLSRILHGKLIFLFFFSFKLVLFITEFCRLIKCNCI